MAANSQVLSQEVLEQAAALKLSGLSERKAAEKLGVAQSTFHNRLVRAAERGFLLDHQIAMPGYSVKSVASKEGDKWVKQVKEAGEQFELPAGHSIKGVSALVDASGREIQKWVKTRNEYAPEDLVKIIKGAFDDVKPAKPITKPVAAKKDLLTLIPCNDWHVNLLTWQRETGTNWDLRIAERVIGEGIEDAIGRSPSSGLAIVLSGGDLTHSDNNENRTAKSGNALDCDGRHQKGLEIACRLKTRTVDAALRRNDKVIVRVLPGNHDEYTAVAVAYYLSAYYRNEPRVVVDLDASLFFKYRFGLVLIGSTHGHTVRQSQMPMLMAHRWAEDWGVTKFRYVHTFHVHHSSKIATEGNGCICETHQAPVPQDAWHYGAGFLSGRSLQTITYHRSYGEISRVRVAILDAEKNAA